MKATRLACVALTVAALGLAGVALPPGGSAQAGLPVTLSAPAPTGEARVVETKQLSPRLKELTIASPAMGGNAMARVLLPTGYQSHPHRRWPVLYLLHGCCDFDPPGYRGWTLNTDVEKFTARANVIIVMPQGDLAGFYSDWVNLGAGGPPGYETFHLVELRRILETRYRAGQRRAIAGLSMGGFGTLSYAGRHPGMFRFAASYSGLVDTQTITSPLIIMGLITAWQHNPLGLWGDPVLDEATWAAHNPTALASRLLDIPLYVASGNGEPGPLDPTPVPDPLEALLWEQNLAFTAKMGELGADITTHLYGPGTHTWPYWEREFHRSFPLIMRALRP